MKLLHFIVSLGGKYCDRSNLTTPAGDCFEGYYCTSGVDRDSPSGAHTGVGGICPTGHKCPTGTVNPVGCDAGTYQVSDSVQVTVVSMECLVGWCIEGKVH